PARPTAARPPAGSTTRRPRWERTATRSSLSWATTRQRSLGCALRARSDRASLLRSERALAPFPVAQRGLRARMMGRSPRFWLLFAFFLVALPVVSRLLPDSDDTRSVRLVELFRLPADAEFVSFRSPYLRGGGEELEGVVQFTPAQWDAYVRTL